ncbi:DUF3135 domain-containing protein [Vibrio sp. PP-XX7]
MNLSRSSYLTLPPFDELVALAEQNPEAFAIFKRDICEEMILSASQKMQKRLWAQQSHIDRVVNSSKNPCHANVKLMQELSTQMQKFQKALISKPDTSQTSHQAEVICLDKYRKLR